VAPFKRMFFGMECVPVEVMTAHTSDGGDSMGGGEEIISSANVRACLEPEDPPDESEIIAMDLTGEEQINILDLPENPDGRRIPTETLVQSGQRSSHESTAWETLTFDFSQHTVVKGRSGGSSCCGLVCARVTEIWLGLLDGCSPQKLLAERTSNEFWSDFVSRCVLDWDKRRQVEGADIPREIDGVLNDSCQVCHVTVVSLMAFSAILVQIGCQPAVFTCTFAKASRPDSAKASDTGVSLVICIGRGILIVDSHPHEGASGIRKGNEGMLVSFTGDEEDVRLVIPWLRDRCLPMNGSDVSGQVEISIASVRPFQFEIEGETRVSTAARSASASSVMSNGVGSGDPVGKNTTQIQPPPKPQGQARTRRGRAAETENEAQPKTETRDAQATDGNQQGRTKQRSERTRTTSRRPNWAKQTEEAGRPDNGKEEEEQEEEGMRRRKRGRSKRRRRRREEKEEKEEEEQEEEEKREKEEEQAPQKKSKKAREKKAEQTTGRKKQTVGADDTEVRRKRRRITGRKPNGAKQTEQAARPDNGKHAADVEVVRGGQEEEEEEEEED
jgi:hypothetical protein